MKYVRPVRKSQKGKEETEPHGLIIKSVKISRSKIKQQDFHRELLSQS